MLTHAEENSRHHPLVGMIQITAERIWDVEWTVDTEQIYFW